MARIFVALLVAAAGTWSDCRQRRIPNRLVAAGITAGFVLWLFEGGIRGLAAWVLGLLAGGIILFIPFALGWVGAGDVKLLAAIGAVLGPKGVACAMLYGAVAGGIMSGAVLVRNRRLGLTLSAVLVGLVGFLAYVIPGLVPRARETFRPFAGTMHVPRSGSAIPYSVAIGIGLVIAIATGFSLTYV